MDFFKSKKKNKLSIKETENFCKYMENSIQINKQIQQNFIKMNPNVIIKDIIDYDFSMSKIKDLIKNMEKQLEDMKYIKNKIHNDYKELNNKLETNIIKLQSLNNLNEYKKILEKKEKELEIKEKKINKILDNFIF